MLADKGPGGSCRLSQRSSRNCKGRKRFPLPQGARHPPGQHHFPHNLLIEKLITAIDLAFLLSLLDLERMTFRIALAGPIWLLPRPRLGRRRKRTPAGPAKPYSVFGDGALIRALVLVNGIFALQTVDHNAG